MEYEYVYSIIKKLMRNLCLNETLCTIYSVLALSETPMTIKEISRATGYSFTMIYSSLKDLMENNLVERVKDGKKIAYSANINFMNLFENRRRRILEEFLEPLSNLDLSKYPNSRRIREIRDYAMTIKNYFKRINSLSNDEILLKK